ncbi:MAG: hypothetical protein EAZ97_03070, partial [Bacteroidetes bacterium]
IEYFPNQAVFWFYNGRAHFSNKNYDESVQSLEQCRLLSQENSEMQFLVYAALEIRPNDSHILNNYSYYLSVRKEKLPLAKEMSKKLVQNEPENATYLDTYGWVLYVLGEYKEAQIYLGKAANDSNEGTILEHYGDVLYKMGEEEKAIITWTKAKKAGGDLTNMIDKKIADRKLYE